MDKRYKNIPRRFTNLLTPQTAERLRTVVESIDADWYVTVDMLLAAALAAWLFPFPVEDVAEAINDAERD